MNSSLNRSLRESLNQKPDRIYFTVIKRGNIYHQRMTCVGNIGKPRASVTVSLRTKSAITAKANAEQLKNKLVSTNGALDCFDNARYTLKNLACTLSTPIGIPLGVPFSCPDNTPTAEPSSSISDKPTFKPMTFTDVAYEYANERLDVSAWTPQTYQGRLSDIKVISEVFGHLGLADKPLNLFVRADLMQVRSELLGMHKVSTVNIKMSLIGAVFKYAELNGAISTNPAVKLSVVDREPKQDKGLAKSDIASIAAYVCQQKIDHFKDKESALYLKWVFLIAAITGARHGEIQQLRREDVQQTESGTWFISINDDNGKQLKNRYSKRCIPLVDSAYGFELNTFIKEVVRTCPAGECLFRSNNRTASRSYFTRIFSKFKALLPAFPQSMTFHSLRHSMSWHCLNSKMPESFTKKLLGHSEGITYGRYASAGVDIDLMKAELSQVLSGT
ncbi:tyrosine-type recombinase/integrase [Photobacterium phosphoreum]|uniref:tyrosine-type recombinase/integrase n=1 Tax=Photobacterium phosphoreum TaxID=659 RepID=UPI000D175C91|nr:tyrosine-type recombinase/integrase [Photobacterium phosphoreum]PSU56724.1 hypothetical protein CTM75_18585 [Photobacterium phosphoreum]